MTPSKSRRFFRLPWHSSWWLLPGPGTHSIDMVQILHQVVYMSEWANRTPGGFGLWTIVTLKQISFKPEPFSQPAFGNKKSADTSALGESDFQNFREMWDATYPNPSSSFQLWKKTAPFGGFLKWWYPQVLIICSRKTHGCWVPPF